MKYRQHKQKEVTELVKKPTVLQEFSTEKIKKFGSETDIKKKNKKSATLPKLPKIKFDKIAGKIPAGIKKQINIIGSYVYLKLPKQLKRLEKSQLKLIAIVLSTLIVLGLGWLIIGGGSNGDKTPKVQGGASIKLSFTPITAPGKSLVPDPEGKRDTGSYRDKIGEVNIRISEQALPNDFKQDTETKLADFAKNNYYNETFMAGPVKIYSGLSIKGVQSVVFTKAGLLVFIKAESRVENNDMADYIKSLR